MNLSDKAGHSTTTNRRLCGASQHVEVCIPLFNPKITYPNYLFLPLPIYTHTQTPKIIYFNETLMQN